MSESLSALYLRDPRSAMAMRRQMFAQALAGKGLSGEPIRAHSQGLNRLAQSALAAMLMYRGDKEAAETATRREEQSSQFQSMLASILGGQPMQSQPPMSAPPSPQPAMAPAQPGMPMPAADFSARIHQNESGGRMTPGIIGDGGRAAGPMQVHQGAIDEVNKRLGTSYTLEQAASNPQVGKLIGDAYAEMMRGQFNQNDPQAMAAFNAGPGRVGRAVAQGGDQWMQAIPASTQGYVQRGMGGQPMAAPAPEQQPNPFEAEIEKARKLQAAAVAAANHPDPAIRSQAPMLMQQATAIEQRAAAGMARMEAQANRVPPTITMQDPDGKSVGIYEMTPQGAGRRLGNAPRQPGESGGPFAGTGMDQQAANTLLAIGPKVQAGTATEAERAQYALAYEHIASGKVSTIPDPTDPTGQRTMLGRVPGVVPPNFPPPGGVTPGMAPAGGGAQPTQAQPGMPTPIPGTAQPTSTANDRSTLKKAEVEAASIMSSLDDFLQTRKRAGTGEIVRSATGLPTELNTTFNAAALMAKGESLFNLGVLNGPDLEIIRRTIADPATFGGALTSDDIVERQINVIRRLIDTRLKAAREQYGGQAPGASQSPPLPQSAARQLKEGIDTEFSNGQVWTLRGGKPERVR